MPKPHAQQSIEELGDRYLVTKEVLAHRYRVSVRTIEFWLQKKRIPGVKVGRQWRFQVEACDRAVDRFTHKAAAI